MKEDLELPLMLQYELRDFYQAHYCYTKPELEMLPVMRATVSTIRRAPRLDGLTIPLDGTTSFGTSRYRESGRATRQPRRLPHPSVYPSLRKPYARVLERLPWATTRCTSETSTPHLPRLQALRPLVVRQPIRRAAAFALYLLLRDRRVRPAAHVGRAADVAGAAAADRVQVRLEDLAEHPRARAGGARLKEAEGEGRRAGARERGRPRHRADTALRGAELERAQGADGGHRLVTAALDLKRAESAPNMGLERLPTQRLLQRGERAGRRGSVAFADGADQSLLRSGAAPRLSKAATSSGGLGI